MARKASVRYWASRGGFCCWHEGSQVLLATGPDDSDAQGPIYKAAVHKFALLKAGPYGVTLRVLAAKFLEWCKPRREEGTVYIYKVGLDHACDKFGDVAIASMQLRQVEEWCDQQRLGRKWNDGMVVMVLKSLKTCLNWGVKGKDIPFNPLAGIEMPPDGARGKEYALSPEDEATVLRACKGRAADFVQALRDTGARPGEIASATAKNYSPAEQALIYEARPPRGEKRHKTHRTGKARVIYLTGRTLATVERLAIERPSGPLFLRPRPNLTGTNRGQQVGYDKKGIQNLMQSLGRKTGIKPLVAYSFRHTYAVRWLTAERPVDVLAELMGTSVKMIREHYGHMAEQQSFLRRMVREFHASRGGT